MLTWLKRVLMAATLVGFAGVVYYALYAETPVRNVAGGRGAGGDAPVPVVVAEARKTDVPVLIEGVGTARARNSVTLKPQVDGRIVSIDFKEGQEVKKGQVLARIEPALYQAQLDQALAKKALDEVQLANAERDLARYAQLTSASVAAKTVDTQRALVAQLQAQLKADEAAIQSARTTLAFATITAPFDGRTGMRLVDEGNLVRSGDAGLVVITEVRPIVVQFTLPQQQLAQVNAALAKGPVPAEALGADSRGVLDTGQLVAVDNQVDQTTGTIKMKAEFPNANLQLWPGQFTNVRLKTDTLQNVVVVPSQSVQRGPKGTIAYVVGPENTVSVRQIAVAMQSETDAVISSGVAAGEQVVTSGFARLREGARVRTGDGPPAGAPGGRPATSDKKAPERVGDASDTGARAAEGAPKGDWSQKKGERGKRKGAEGATQ